MCSVDNIYHLNQIDFQYNFNNKIHCDNKLQIDKTKLKAYYCICILNNYTEERKESGSAPLIVFSSSPADDCVFNWCCASTKC